MSQGTFIPIGQKRLTNIAIVRLKKAGKRFEIACYKNTVLAWRKKVETDINEVVQTTTIFANVGKGILAKHDDIKKAFGTLEEEDVCKVILDKGELQVSEKERKVEYETLFRDVASVLVEKCINPETSRPHTIGIIERGLKDVHFSVDPKRSAKQQALEIIPALQEKFPIKRARMRLHLEVPEASAPALRETLDKEKASAAAGGAERGAGAAAAPGMVAMVVDVEPGSFRVCDQTTRGLGGRVEVVSLAVVEEGESTTEFGTVAMQGGGGGGGAGTDLADQFGGLTVIRGPTKVEPSAAPPPVAAAGGVGKLKCITCGAAFEDRAQHREHFKSDWHRINQKRKSEGQDPLTKEEAENDHMFDDKASDLHDYM